MGDPKNIQDKTDLNEALNGAQKGISKKALEIVFDNMQHNFEQIRKGIRSNEIAITDLKIQIATIQHLPLEHERLKNDLANLEKNFDKHCIEGELSNTRLFKSALGVGGLGGLVVILQLLTLVFGGA